MNIRNNAVLIAAVFLWAQALVCAAAKDDNLLLEANYQINGMIWSADGSLFGVSEDNTFVIYDSATEQVRRSFPVRRSFVADAAFSQSADSSRTGGSEQFVSLLSADGTIELWSYTHDVLLDTVSIGEDVRSNGFAVSPGTEYLGAGLSDGRIRVYMRLQYTNRLLARDITGHEKLVYSLAFTPDGKYLVSASLDNTIRVWETASGVCAAVIKYKPRGRIPVRCIQGSALAAPDSEAGTAPEGPFIDCGMMFRSDGIKVQNSIDPFYIEDSGNKYLFWGSFRGIYYIELTKDGLQVKEGCKPIKIAGTAFEGTYIHKRDGYYYLFASIGTCCEGIKSTYTTVVGRSKSLFGPYLNKKGEFMMDNKYEVLIGKNKQFVGTGHNSEIITDNNGTDWIMYHAVKVSEPHGRVLMLDKVEWKDGWPVVNNSTPSLVSERPKFK